MRFTHSEYFQKTKTEGSSHYYNYKGEFTGQNLGFEFQLPGDGGNGALIDKSDYFDKNIEITYIFFIIINFLFRFIQMCISFIFLFIII